MFKPRVDLVGKQLSIIIDMEELEEAIDSYCNRKFALESMPVTEGNKKALEFLKKSMLNDILEGKIFAFQ